MLLQHFYPYHKGYMSACHLISVLKVQLGSFDFALQVRSLLGS
uniref:Uncharacterized protein n=1 Tax=Arundo donax TaxID=35708 RepID=A0A0A9B8P8_ARUDO